MVILQRRSKSNKIITVELLLHLVLLTFPHWLKPGVAARSRANVRSELVPSGRFWSFPTASRRLCPAPSQRSSDRFLSDRPGGETEQKRRQRDARPQTANTQVTFPAANLFVRWLDARHEHPIAVDKLNKGVADWVTGTADSNGLHHAGVSELTHTQLPVKELPRDGEKNVLFQCL